MDAKAKQALVDKMLKLPKSFDELLGGASRKWFVESIIKAREAAGDSDAAIEQKTKDLIAATMTLVKAERDFPLALTADGNKRFTAKLLKDFRRNRVEILYGAIALEPRLVETAQRDYLRFLAKRRLRAVCRQFIWVNPNGQGYFRYPDDCPGNDEWRPNDHAGATYWSKTPYPDDTPFTLKAAGIVDPVAAVKDLFLARSDPCKSNLTDCAVVADITFLDALLEAKNSSTFLKQLPAAYLDVTMLYDAAFASQGAATENPVARVPVAMPAKDLQVGDQAYIFNHPLYRTFRPTGNWTGEWAFVYAAGDRNYKSEKGFVFGGHGMEGTLFKFYKNFVNELGSHLSLARQLATVHLALMAGGAAAIAPGTVISDSEDDVKIYDPVARSYKAAVRHRLLAYDSIAKARDFTKIPTKLKKKPKAVMAGFLILHSKVEDAFYLAKIDTPKNSKPLSDNLKKTAAEIPAPRQVHYPIRFKRVKPAAAGASNAVRYAVTEWGIEYYDKGAAALTTWPFFETVAGELKRKELSTAQGGPVDALFDAPFSLFNKGGGTDIRVFQPRVDFGTHRAFLAAHGAF